MRRFRPCTLDQPLLVAPSLHDWLPEAHLARFIAEVVAALDLQPILDPYFRKNNRGAEGYHPEMLTRLLLYGYATGLTSSRRIEKATYDSVPFRYLAADQHPDHDTIANFRRQHLEARQRADGPRLGYALLLVVLVLSSFALRRRQIGVLILVRR